MKEDQFVVIAIPTYSHQCSIEFAISLAATCTKLAVAGVKHAIVTLGGNCFVDQARNVLIQKFLNFELCGKKIHATDLFFIDDDVGFPMEAAVDLITRPEDIVFGVYPKKTDSAETFPVSLKIDDDGKFIESDDGALKLADTVCGGFLRIKRHVLERLMVGERQYPFFDAEMKAYPIWNIFENGMRGQVYWGEDISFAYKAQAAGFDLWCKPDINFTHRGTKLFRGNVAQFLKGRKT